MKRVFIVVIGTLLLAVSGYAQTAVGGIRWELTELNGKRVANSRAFIEFDEASSRFSGNAGCNRMFGRYELNGTRFKAGNVGVTKMACSGKGVARQEAAFLEALRNADRLRRNGATLTLRDAGDRVLKFQRVRKNGSEAADLTSKKWMLRSVNGKTVDLRKNAPFLNFDPDKGSAGGNSGCNAFGGEYSVTGSSIRFGDMIQTMMACEFEGRMQVERGFMDGLRNANRFEIRGNRLTLYRGNRELLAFEGVSK